MITVTNEDNMIMMARYPDDYFDLAIVDPPYGIGVGKMSMGYSNHKKKDWDNIQPSLKYFIELKRVSKNQIVWGANYFTDFIKLGKGIICWWKHQNGNFSQWEMAHTTIGNAKHFDRSYQQDQYNKIHPTQKPILLMEYLIKTYTNEQETVLDFTIGSGTTMLACKNLNRNGIGIEKDETYFKISEERINKREKLQEFNFNEATT
jgi:site-specific DNA-methyltransferase (adenine-specific)